MTSKEEKPRDKPDLLGDLDDDRLNEEETLSVSVIEKNAKNVEKGEVDAMSKEQQGTS